MPLVLRQPRVHAPSVARLEQAILEVADSIWDGWRSHLRAAFESAVRTDRAIDGDAAVSKLPPRVQSSLARLQRELVSRVSDTKIAEVSRVVGSDVERTARSNFDRQIEREIGRRFRTKPDIGEAMRRFRRDAVLRISSVRDTAIPTLSKDVAHAYANGWDADRLAKHWEEKGLPLEYGTVQGRAKVLASDQLAKLNAAVTREVHRSLGIDEYRWRRGKSRPHHTARHGLLFSWKKPPAGGHPGTEPNCACGADAELDDETLAELARDPSTAIGSESMATPIQSSPRAIPSPSARPARRATRAPSIPRRSVRPASPVPVRPTAERREKTAAERKAENERRARESAERLFGAPAPQRTAEERRKENERRAREGAEKLFGAPVPRTKREPPTAPAPVPAPAPKAKPAPAAKKKTAPAPKAAPSPKPASLATTVTKPEITAEERVRKMHAMAGKPISQAEAKAMVRDAMRDPPPRPEPFSISKSYGAKRPKSYKGMDFDVNDIALAVEDLSAELLFSPSVGRVADAVFEDEADAFCFSESFSPGRYSANIEFKAGLRKSVIDTMDEDRRTGWRATHKHPDVVAAIKSGSRSDAADFAMRGIGIHEFGHAQHFMLEQAEGAIERELINEFNRLYKESTAKERSVVSKYAMTDEYEFFAETYMAASTGMWDIVPKRFEPLFRVLLTRR